MPITLEMIQRVGDLKDNFSMLRDDLENDWDVQHQATEILAELGSECPDILEHLKGVRSEVYAAVEAVRQASISLDDLLGNAVRWSHRFPSKDKKSPSKKGKKK